VLVLGRSLDWLVTVDPHLHRIHELFADDAHEALLRAGAAEVVTCDAVPHGANGIPLAPLLAPAVAAIIAEGCRPGAE